MFSPLASQVSKTGLENIYSKVLQTVGDIQEEIEKVSTEPDVLPQDASEDALEKHGLTQTEFNILRVMLEGKYLYRTLTGLSKGAKLSKNEVNEALGSLMARGLVEQKINKEGNLRWYLSPSGRRLIGQLALEQQSEEAG